MGAKILRPVNIVSDRDQRRVVVHWSDGFRHAYPWSFLRAHCPSATERVARENANPLQVLAKIPSSDLVGVRLVGSYAIGLTWADGHAVGIYTWEYLRRLSDDPAVETLAIG
ncbi:MAG: gamma-butyrobetaine hydroxylase-like domain-containing protein [Planctomycetia bacterium]